MPAPTEPAGVPGPKQPTPAPLMWEYGSADDGAGTRLVLVRVWRGGDPFTMFLTPAEVRGLIAQLERMAVHVATGLVIANGDVT